MCTGIVVQLANGQRVFARTLEFAEQLIWQQRFTETYKGTFGHVLGDKEDDRLFMADGMNQAGLFCGAFFFPTHNREGNYFPVDPAKLDRQWATTEVCEKIVSTFETVQELRDAFADDGIEITLGTVETETAVVPFSFHWLVGDSLGELAVVECVDQKIYVHDNDINVIANEPEWPKIREYYDSFRSPQTAHPLTKYTLPHSCYQGTGQGDPSGLCKDPDFDPKSLPNPPMPGDPTSPSRLVRAGFYVENLVPPSASLGLDGALRVLHAFDIPYGSIYESDKEGAAIEVVEYTVAYHVGCYEMKYAPYGWKQDINNPEPVSKWFQTDMPVKLWEGDFLTPQPEAPKTPQIAAAAAPTTTIHIGLPINNSSEISRLERRIRNLRRRGGNRRRIRSLRRRIRTLRNQHGVTTVTA